ncbi:hypothetical protein GCM10027258_71920 [Amycolatopsis stemonae]
MGDQGYSGQVTADRPFFGVFEPQVDVARRAVAQPGQEQHTAAIQLAGVAVGEETVVTERSGERFQICGAGRPDIWLGHLQKLLFAAGTSSVPEASGPDQATRPAPAFRRACVKLAR